MDGLHLVPVATGLSDFEAKLLAAQLGSEGILWQTRGIVDSIYPFGGIDVLVPAGQLDDARDALVVAAEPMVLDDPGVEGAADARSSLIADGVPIASPSRSRWMALAAAAAVVAVVVGRVVMAI